MFTIYFLLPAVAFLISEIPTFRRSGVKNRIKQGSFWILMLTVVLAVIAMLMFLFMSFTAFLDLTLIKLIAAAVCSVFFAALVKAIGHIRRTKETLAMLLLSVALAAFLEGTVFNFRFYQTHDYVERDLSDSYSVYKFDVSEDDPSQYIIPEDVSSPYIEITDINEKVNNVYFDFTTINANGYVVNSYIDVYMTDESNARYLKLPSQTVMTEVEETKFLHLITNGATEKLKFVISTSYGKLFEINSIKINVPQQFNFEIIRLFAVAIIIFLFWLLRPSSKLWSYGFSDSVRQRIIICAVIVLEIAILLSVSVLNPAFAKNPSRHTAQYQQLAESFLDGKLYLAEEPSDFLAQMENPYDYNDRRYEASANGTSYYWDAAYYNGHYYVYFGVVPVLLLYLPYRAITGADLPNLAAIQVFLVLFAIGSFLLIGKFLKKYFDHKRVPFLSYILLTLIFINASGGIFIAKRPDFYSVPIISALAFTVFGLYFWMMSDEGGRIRPLYAALGSLCMALVAGCRPQLLVVSAMAIIIFWYPVFKDRSLFSKKGLWSTVAICIPYVIVAAGIMWYNNARFGSPFDFGANYNLTTNDMTGRGFRVERVGLAIFTYFLQPPKLTAAFPFLDACTISTNYLGTTITEPTFGGIFVVIPILWSLALLPSLSGKLKKRGMLAFCLLPLILSVFLGVFDAQGAGLLQRYVSDFAFLACFAAIVIFFVCYERTRSVSRLKLHSFLRFAFFASAAYCFMCIFAKYSVEIFQRSPYLFNSVSEMVQFW